MSDPKPPKPSAPLTPPAPLTSKTSTVPLKKETVKISLKALKEEAGPVLPKVAGSGQGGPTTGPIAPAALPVPGAPTLDHTQPIAPTPPSAAVGSSPTTGPIPPSAPSPAVTPSLTPPPALSMPPSLGAPPEPPASAGERPNTVPLERAKGGTATVPLAKLDPPASPSATVPLSATAPATIKLTKDDAPSADSDQLASAAGDSIDPLGPTRPVSTAPLEELDPLGPTAPIQAIPKTIPLQSMPTNPAGTATTPLDAVGAPLVSATVPLTSVEEGAGTATLLQDPNAASNLAVIEDEDDEEEAANNQTLMIISIVVLILALAAFGVQLYTMMSLG